MGSWDREKALGKNFKNLNKLCISFGSLMGKKCAISMLVVNKTVCGVFRGLYYLTFL